MLLIIALAALGVGYAWWTEQIMASGTIQTGNFDVHMDNASTAEDDPLNAAICSLSFSDNGKIMGISVQNGYPGYSCRILFDLNNHGSIPTKVIDVHYTNGEDDFEISSFGALSSKPLLYPAVPVSAELLVKLLPDAEPKTTYRFDLSIDIAQGNAP